jgi:hypothetical protein
LDQKFLVQAAPVVGDRNATELLARCWDIESTDDVQSIIAASAAPR